MCSSFLHHFESIVLLFQFLKKLTPFLFRRNSSRYVGRNQQQFMQPGFSIFLNVLDIGIASLCLKTIQKDTWKLMIWEKKKCDKNPKKRWKWSFWTYWSNKTTNHIKKKKAPCWGKKENPLVLYTNYYKTILLCIAIPRKTQNLLSLWFEI